MPKIVVPKGSSVNPPLIFNTPISQQSSYVENLSDYILRTGTIVSSCNTSDTGTLTTIYTVPVGQTLFITGLTLGYLNILNTGSGSPSLYLNGSEALRFSASTILGYTDQISLSPTIPIKLLSGNSIKIDGSGTSHKITGSFIGYLVPNEYEKTRL
jgi:hypothetical protein